MDIQLKRTSCNLKHSLLLLPFQALRIVLKCGDGEIYYALRDTIGMDQME